MKINNKIIRLKRFVKPLFHYGRSVAILLTLALVLSFSLITAVPAAAQIDYYVATDGSDTYGNGTETWVDNDSSGDWNVVDTGPWLTISYAISKASSGDTINVAEGTYKLEPDSEGISIYIDKDDLTLKAVGATEDTIIDFSLCGIAIRIIKVDKATIEGFTMKGGGSGHQAFQVIGLETNPVSNVNILNNVITGTTDSAINLYGAWGPVTGVTISGNTIDNCHYGIMAGAGVSDSTISNNTITNSTQDDPDWGALAFFGEISGITISGNEVSSNENLNGIYLGSGTYDDILVENSIISNNLGGVMIANGVNFTNLVINYNNIEDNTTGVLNESALLVYAEANWWGDATGPYHATTNSPGQGNAVSDNVNFIPFLGSSSPGGEVVNEVSITKSGLTSANSGDDITYTITYKNIGTNYATNVVITETYPSEVEYVSADPEPDTGNNQWTIGTLDPGEGGTITVTVHIK